MPILREELDDDKIILKIEGSKGNSFSADMLESLSQELDNVVNDDTINGIILTGAGRSFSVGGDVFAMFEALEQNDPGLYLDVIVPLIEKLILQMIEFPKPIVAAVNGAAAGAGLSLMLACDHVVSVENAKFGMGFGGLGLSPDSGSSVLFSHYFGRKETMLGVANARVYTATELADRDIVSVVSTDELINKAAEYVDNASGGSLFSYGKSKILVNQPLINQLHHNLPMEYRFIKEAASREEFETKVREMIEKLTKR